MLLKFGSSSLTQFSRNAAPSSTHRPAVAARQPSAVRHPARRLRMVVRSSEADVEQQEAVKQEQQQQQVQFQQQQEAQVQGEQESGNGTEAQAEASQGQEEAGPSTSEEGEQQQQQQMQTTPMERARQALASAPIDQELLEASLSELDEEVARLQAGVASAESRATMLEGTLQTAKDQLLRLNADFDNFRRRSAGEKEAIASKVTGDVVAELLPLVDNFELARTQVKVGSEGENKINSSYQALYKQLVDVMRGFGIEAVPTVGVAFDPEVHDAMMREHSDEIPDGHISQEFRKGFKMGEKLVRPAMVMVSMGPASPPEAPAPPQEEPAPSESSVQENA
ncbi:GrpE-domain-containing protein [Dunaliella salina]|uniref:GrpE protein homolog n=1 Tax=Dunaliella salina TaxID=3046 RepID=A0ABQ7G4Q5_DUNSA|nr:GrpE-domain-containing protein [Dunaliella salina]|eukprot:KAF5829589.1 GrpE-domain-containing protein [Dunaliella salina]